MKPSKTSKQWMREHVNDPFVQLAQKEGYRSRAAYKLLEIDAKDHLLKPGTVVVDLGATPGGWSQVAAAKVGRGGKVIALDLLPLDPLAGVDFIQGDFREEAVLRQLENLLQGKQVGLVISDMAPNISRRGIGRPGACHASCGTGDGFRTRTFEAGRQFPGQGVSGCGVRGFSQADAQSIFQGGNAQTQGITRSQQRAVFAGQWKA